MAELEGLPSGQDKVDKVRSMFDAIAPRYDLVNRVMTAGMDTGWRRRAVTALLLPKDSLVLDVACGTGDLCNELLLRSLRPVGFDLSAGMLTAAKTEAPLVQADALNLPVRDGAADGVTCGFALRNVVDLRSLFEEMTRVLRRSGRIALLEVGEPRNRLVKIGHGAYFNKVVPFIGGVLSDREAYSYLPRSVAYLPPVPELLSTIREAGFHDLQRRTMGLGAAQLITATRD